jgi:polyhydroxyalkanoate synthase subunit PhaC
MPTSMTGPAWDPVALANQLQNIAKQSQKLVQTFLSERPGIGQVGIGDVSAVEGAFLDLTTKMIADPAAVAHAQIDLFNDSLKVWQNTAERAMFLRTNNAEGPKDKRFKNPEWTENALLLSCLSFEVFAKAPW